ncbi:hypothetical protein WS73_23045 [Burkholderia savannae]|nr:hypothetical protein WS73_23045 [Burkholderia savannae]
MPKTVVPLNDTRIKALKPKAARYRISDGGGLVLEVMTSGSKVWRYRYTLHGERQPMVATRNVSGHREAGAGTS